MKTSKSIPKTISEVTREVEKHIYEDLQERREQFTDRVMALTDFVYQKLEAEKDFGSFERNLWEMLMAVGLAASELFLASNREVPKSMKIYDEQEKVYKYKGEKHHALRCMYGQGEYYASEYVRGEKVKEHRIVVPLDSQVGLFPTGGLSPNIALETAELSTRMPYEHVFEILGRFYKYVPSKRSICGLIDLLGHHGGEALGSVTLEAGEVAVIQVDARGIPTIRPEEYIKRCQPHQKHGGKRRRKSLCEIHTRRTRGQKGKKKKQVTVGLIYTFHRLSDGSLEGPLSKLYVAHFGSAEVVFKQLRRALDQIESGVKQVVFLSDGAPHYKRLREQYFANAIATIDFYHVCEYLWKAGETVYKEGSKELESFVIKLKKLLMNDRAGRVLEILREKEKELPSKGPGSKGKRERMQESITYISNRLDLMPYKKLREEGLEIGSGAIESAIRQVVVIRFDGPGMRWGEKRAPQILNLLCLRLSGGWSKLESRIQGWTHEFHIRTRMTPVGVNEKKSLKGKAELPEIKDDFPMAVNQ